MNSLTKMSPKYQNSASTCCIMGLSGKVIRLSFIDSVVFIEMILLCVIVLHDALVSLLNVTILWCRQDFAQGRAQNDMEVMLVTVTHIR